MMAGEVAYSPGERGLVVLGSAQALVHHELERLLADASTVELPTTRAIAATLGLNPGVVSRALHDVVRLGLYAIETRRGRLGGMTIWRVVRERLRKLRRRGLALRRMLAPAPGQLTLALADGPRPAPRAWWDNEPDDEPELDLDEPLTISRPATAPRVVEPEPLPPSSGEYGMTRCECGRLRLTFGGQVAGPCVHA